MMKGLLILVLLGLTGTERLAQEVLLRNARSSSFSNSNKAGNAIDNDTNTKLVTDEKNKAGVDNQNEVWLKIDFENKPAWINKVVMKMKSGAKNCRYQVHLISETNNGGHCGGTLEDEENKFVGAVACKERAKGIMITMHGCLKKLEVYEVKVFTNCSVGFEMVTTEGDNATRWERGTLNQCVECPAGTEGNS